MDQKWCPDSGRKIATHNAWTQYWVHALCVAISCPETGRDFLATFRPAPPFLATPPASPAPSFPPAAPAPPALSAPPAYKTVCKRPGFSDLSPITESLTENLTENLEKIGRSKQTRFLLHFSAVCSLFLRFVGGTPFQTSATWICDLDLRSRVPVWIRQ